MTVNPEINTLTPPFFIISIDCGSTNVKIKLHKFTEERCIETNDNLVWQSLKPSERTYGNSQEIYKLLDVNNLATLLDWIQSEVDKIRNQINTAPIFIITGFTNSLAVRYRGQTLVLLDDPSLQSKIIGIKPTSSIMKLLTLSNSPAALASLFQPDTKFENLIFGTMLGVITEKLTGNPDDFGVPLDDTRGFEIAQNSISLTKIKPKLSIHSSKLIQNDGVKVIELNDFFAETYLLSDMMANQIIPPQSIILGLDTVGKIIWAGPKSKDFQVINNLNYEIQRVTGSINPNWNKLLFQSPNGENPDYETINQVLGKSITQNLTTDYLFYPDFNDLEKHGLLFQKLTDRSIKQVFQSELTKNLDDNQKKQIILAIAQGMFFGLRQRIELTWKNPEELKTKPIICYGGLGSNNQTAWNELFADIFADISDDIKRLELPSVNQAAAYSGIKQIGGDPKIPQIQIRQLASSADTNSLKIRTRREEYFRWLQYKHTIGSPLPPMRRDRDDII